jgi:DNA-binding XRE family transcriptional regulator
MVAFGTLTIGREDYVVIPRREYERLVGVALPVQDIHGERPAAQTVLAIMARSLTERRVKAGLSQETLAAKAGVRPETISRIESGRFRPRRETMLRLDSVLGA